MIEAPSRNHVARFENSGYGRDSGMESLRGYQQTKSVWIDLS